MRAVIGMGNRKAVKLKTKFGMLTYAELAYKLGYDSSYVRSIVKRLGVDAVVDKLDANNGPSHATVKYNGKELSVRQVENMTGFSYTFIRNAGVDCVDNDVTNHIKNVIADRNINPSISMIKMEERRIARIGTIATGKDFAKCAARSN